MTNANIEMNPTTVAILGTGTMGSAMARRLLGAGMVVVAWDRTPARAEQLRGPGARVQGDVHRASASAQVVLTTLATADAVRQLMVEDHVIDSLATGSIWAQMGTIGVEETVQLAAEVSSRRPDVLFVDAPVSGSRQPAEAGELLVLASGPDQARPVLEPIFAAIGKRTLWLGAAGSGTRLKLVLNTWLAFEVEAAAESAALADRLGVAPEALADALNGSPLASPLALAKLSRIRASDYSADFSLQWALKDLDLACEAAGPDPVPVARAIARRWRTLVEAGSGPLDVSAAALGLGLGGSEEAVEP